MDGDERKRREQALRHARYRAKKPRVVIQNVSSSESSNDSLGPDSDHDQPQEGLEQYDEDISNSATTSPRSDGEVIDGGETEDHDGIGSNDSADEELENQSNSEGESDGTNESSSDQSEAEGDSEASLDVGSEGDDTESSDEENANDDNIGNGNEWIYPGAPITLQESLLAIFTLFSVEKLSAKLVSNILLLIALHCPEGSIVRKTLATFKRYFVKLGEALIVYHYFCSDCIYPLETKTARCPKCKKSDNVSYFLELPLIYQLQNLFRQQNFYEDLQFRFKADRKRNKNNIEDIYDSSMYKEQMTNGFLQNPRNISFMLYSDGIAIFKSSKFSIWPLCLVINELPYKSRTLPSNILLVGLWFGSKKPNPNIFLRPLCETLKSFERDGHTFKLFDNSEVLVKGKLLCWTCDLPAKCRFLNIKQFNSYYGCPKCMAKGGRADVGKTTVQVYPFQPNFEMRTHEQNQDFARQALEARKKNKDASVFGVKGPTLLSKMVPDIIKCTAIDIMHGVFLGVFKTLLDLWLSSSFSGMPWSVHHLYDVLDEKLSKMKSPSFADRAPRSLKEIKFWKASEFKQFMLYYSVPLLKNVLENEYLKHHCMLVSAISLLSQDSISFEQVQAASALLTSYVSDFARLYPLRYLGINVHQLLHLGDVTLELGPCWVYSCFFLESFNGFINKMFHGTQHIALQICSTVSMMMKIPEYRNLLPPDSKAKEFCLRIECGLQRVKIADVIDANTLAVGKFSSHLQSIRHSTDIIVHRFQKERGNCCVFYRLQKKGVVYYAEEYGRKSSRKESSFILFQEDGALKIGRIVRFVRWSNCGNLCDIDCRGCAADYIAIIQIFERKHWFIHDFTNIRIPQISKVDATQNITAINVKCISCLCYYFEIDNEKFVANLVNRLENE